MSKKSYTRKDNSWLIALLPALIPMILVGIIYLGGQLFMGNFKDTVTITVTEKVPNSGSGNKYLILGKTDKGETVSLENTDTIVNFKYDSSDIYEQIVVGKTYEFKVIGVRIRPLSWYKNIMEFKEIP